MTLSVEHPSDEIDRARAADVAARPRSSARGAARRALRHGPAPPQADRDGRRRSRRPLDPRRSARRAHARRGRPRPGRAHGDARPLRRSRGVGRDARRRARRRERRARARRCSHASGARRLDRAVRRRTRRARTRARRRAATASPSSKRALSSAKRASRAGRPSERAAGARRRVAELESRRSRARTAELEAARARPWPSSRPADDAGRARSIDARGELDGTRRAGVGTRRCAELTPSSRRRSARSTRSTRTRKRSKPSSPTRAARPSSPETGRELEGACELELTASARTHELGQPRGAARRDRPRRSRGPHRARAARSTRCATTRDEAIDALDELTRGAPRRARGDARAPRSTPPSGPATRSRSTPPTCSPGPKREAAEPARAGEPRRGGDPPGSAALGRRRCREESRRELRPAAPRASSSSEHSSA